MAKVYRIHTEAHSGQNSDWFESLPINKKLIAGIDTGSGDGKKLPTSIPSPFARLDLVRTAFESVAETNLDGLMINGAAVNTDNHKLVSDALDIAQIFFNYSKFAHKLEIIAWDCKQNLNELRTSDTRGHQLLGETLHLFMQQDDALYNFNACPFIYILLYDGKPIGGTSPKTLFFAAPDATETDIKFGQDTMLDDGLNPLYKRDPIFIKYLFALSQTPQFPSRFKEFYNYLEATKKKLQSIKPDLYREIENLNNTALDGFHPLYLDGNQGHPLEIINGLPVKEFVKKPADIEAISDFVIASPKCPIDNKPLVLPTNDFQHQWRYTEDLWVSGQEVPSKVDEHDLAQRRLPFQNDLYPFLTIGDFLEDIIIKTSYPIDEIHFYTAGEPNYLLPLTKLFFEFFNVQDILEKDMIKINSLAGDAVEVTLKIPVKKGNYIVYNKKYQLGNADLTNYGKILSQDFILSIYPTYACQEIDVDYHIGLVQEKKSGNKLYSIKPLDNGASLGSESTERNPGIGDLFTHHTLSQNFNLLEIGFGENRNFLIPKLKAVSSQGGDTFEFAIDFGTTNTHIEYKIPGQGNETSFNFSNASEELISFTYRQGPAHNGSSQEQDDMQDYLIQEMFNRSFGTPSSDHKSPFRTVILENQNIDYAQAPKLYSDANIGFDYEQKFLRSYLRSRTNLKWAMNDDSKGKARARLFIQQLIELCRNKVLINDGNLEQTKLTWYYPVSMSTAHLDALKQIWQNTYEQFFLVNPDSPQNIFGIPESISPLFYFKEKEGIHTHDRPTVSIDIGGGTTDILIYQENETKVISSFRYAGNALYGNGLNGNIANNGFLNKYLERYKEIIRSNKLSDLSSVLDQLDNGDSSTDIISFLFSLADNEKVLRNGLKESLDLHQNLREDEELKIVFLIFYLSITYHIAQIFKLSNLDPPRNLLFSGTASKSLTILESPPQFKMLSKLFKKVFCEVLDVDSFDFTIKHQKNPKESTAKGGFYYKETEEDFRKRILVHLGDDCDSALQSPIFSNENTLAIRDVVHSGLITNIEQNINSFHDLIDKLHTEFNFTETFGVSQNSLNAYSKLRDTDDTRGELLQGLHMTIAPDNNQDNPVPESLFFYPFHNLLYNLANHENE